MCLIYSSKDMLKPVYVLDLKKHQSVYLNEGAEYDIVLLVK